MTIKKKLMLPAAIILVAAAVCIGYLYMGSIDSEAENSYIFYGTAEAEQIDVSAEVSGRVKEVKVQEGQKVAAGSLLALIDTPENRIKAEQSGIAAESAENELKKLEEGNREEEINIQRALVQQAEAAVRTAEAGVKQAEQSLKSAQETYDLKKKQYDDMKVLFDNGAAALQDLDNSEYAMNMAAYSMESAGHSADSAEAQLSSSESQLAASREKLTLLINGAEKRSINASEYGVEQAEKGLELAKLVLDRSKVLAANDGIVEMINFSEGEYVSVGSPLMTITDQSDLWVKIYVPERILPGLKLGKPVIIRCDYLKEKEIKGQIIYISPEAEFTPVNIVTKEDRMKLVFAVKVKILDNLDIIKPGMLLDVNIR